MQWPPSFSHGPLGLRIAAENTAEVTKYDQLDQTYQQLKTQLTDEINADQVEIKKLQGQLKVVVKADILFSEGGWELSPNARQTLDKLVPVLAQLNQTRIVVNGYTDNLPVGPELRAKGVTSNRSRRRSKSRTARARTAIDNHGPPRKGSPTGGAEL